MCYLRILTWRSLACSQLECFSGQANEQRPLLLPALLQVYTQPVFSLLEAPFRARRPAGAELPIFLQFGMRMVYVLLCTIVALLIPFFGSLMGLVGAIAVTPTTFLFPPLLWVMYKRPKRWGADWTASWSLVWITGVLGVLGCIGSIYSIIVSWSTFKIFAN